MTNSASASGADLWGSSLDGTAALAHAAEGALRHAESAGIGDLAAGSPVVLAVLAVGLALWLVGDRLFRPASSLLGAGVGAMLGLLAAGSIQSETLAGMPTPYAAIGLGSLLGLGVGAAMYRLAVGSAAALTLGAVAAVLAAALTLHGPGAGGGLMGGWGGVPERPETIAETASARAARATVEHVGFGDGVGMDSLRAAAASANSFAQTEWAALPEQTRSLVLAAAILGCVVGFAAGLIRPRTAGPAIAALAGAALWLGATTVLLARAGQPVPALPTQQPGAWLLAWLLVALVGFAVQRRVIRPAALLAKDE